MDQRRNQNDKQNIPFAQKVSFAHIYLKNSPANCGLSDLILT